jgi:hypothetical protein
MKQRKQKPSRIRINISSSFRVRTCCKHCQGKPSFIYHIPLSFVWKDVADYLAESEYGRTFFTTLPRFVLMRIEPRLFNGITEFNLILDDKSFSPRAHYTKPMLMTKKPGQFVPLTEILSCKCGATTWAFNQRSVIFRPEVVMRKGKYCYPANS